MNLVGEIKGAIETAKEQELFMRRLKMLMVEFGVDKVDVGWGLPMACERCGEKPQGAVATPESVVEELDPGDPRLDETGPELKPGLEKSEALDLLDGVVDKMPDQGIELEIPQQERKCEGHPAWECDENCQK